MGPALIASNATTKTLGLNVYNLEIYLCSYCSVSLTYFLSTELVLLFCYLALKHKCTTFAKLV